MWKQILGILLALLFSSCQSRVGEPTTSLTIRICEETTVSESVYPLQLTVSTETPWTTTIQQGSFDM